MGDIEDAAGGNEGDVVAGGGVVIGGVMIRAFPIMPA